LQQALVDGQAGAQPQRVVIETDEDRAGWRMIGCAVQEGAFIELTVRSFWERFSTIDL
jgi:hypothetical protein